MNSHITGDEIVQELDAMIDWFCKMADIPDISYTILKNEYLIKKSPNKITIRNECVLKLIKDGFIQKIEITNEVRNNDESVQSSEVVEGYRITVEGLFFKSAGGYRGRILEKNLAERRVQISQTLTWILAVGVTTPFVWYLLDTINKFYPFAVPIFFVVLVFLVGACLGAALWRILKLIDKAIEKKRLN